MTDTQKMQIATAALHGMLANPTAGAVHARMVTAAFDFAELMAGEATARGYLLSPGAGA